MGILFSKNESLYSCAEFSEFVPRSVLFLWGKKKNLTYPNQFLNIAFYTPPFFSEHVSYMPLYRTE